jgi:cation diffusion facilitator family transporter
MRFCAAACSTAFATATSSLAHCNGWVSPLDYRSVTGDAQTKEILALRLSLVLTVLFAVGAAIVAMFSDSETMSLEAMSGGIDITVCVLAIFVARKIHKPANHRYHFGYAKYEPLMTTVEGLLLTGVCVAAIVYAVRDLLHPDPVKDTYLVVIYSALSFLLSVLFGYWMRRAGRRSGSQLVLANANLWIVEGWQASGVCAAFVIGIALSRVGTTEATAYIDPATCIVLSVIFLRKPFEILRESVADLVDANPYADTVNAIEDSARMLAERFHLKGLEWVRVRKAGSRVFVMVSFFEEPAEPLEQMDIARQAVIDEMVALHPDIDVAVLFRAAPSQAGAVPASG